MAGDAVRDGFWRARTFGQSEDHCFFGGKLGGPKRKAKTNKNKTQLKPKSVRFRLFSQKWSKSDSKVIQKWFNSDSKVKIVIPRFPESDQNVIENWFESQHETIFKKWTKREPNVIQKY